MGNSYRRETSDHVKKKTQRREGRYDEKLELKRLATMNRDELERLADGPAPEELADLFLESDDDWVNHWVVTHDSGHDRENDFDE